MYPTKEKILERIEKIKIKKKTISTVLLWKHTTKNKQTYYAMKNLIKKLDETYNKEKTKIILDNTKKTASYNKKTNTITLTNYSKITALHEYAHKLFGRSELKACAWSIKVFMIVFPKTFKKLKWEGHMLKKP